MKLHKLLLVVLVSLVMVSVVRVQNVFAPYVSGGESFPLAGPLNISFPSNSTYDTNSLDLIVTSTYLLGPKYAEFCYSLDEEQNVSITLTGNQEPREATRTYANGTVEKVNSTLNVPFTLNGKTTLSGLAKGQHTLTVYAKYTANNVIGHDKSTVHFTVSPKFLTLTEAINAVSEGNIGQHISHGGCNGESVLEPYVHESGVTAYLLWVATNGTLFQAEYPSGNVVGKYLENYNFDYNISSSFYVWDLDYGNSETYWIEATNGTILRLTPQRLLFYGDKTDQPTEHLATIAAAIIIISIVSIVYWHKKKNKK
jgi:hypothetical protein